MDNSPSRFKKIDVKYSITDKTLQLNNKINDNLNPYTLIEWLNNIEIEIQDPEKYINDYNAYLRKWNQVTAKSQADSKKTIVETYTSLIKEIVINYSSGEEKRFFANLDYTNKTELDTVLPFFAKRIKEIILFITKKRDAVKYQKVKNSLIGSRQGVKKLIRDKTFSILAGDDIDTTIGQALPDIEKITPNFRIEIDELYDLSEDYYDVHGSTDNTVTTQPGNSYG
jgi:hypothetical protein